MLLKEEELSKILKPLKNEMMEICDIIEEREAIKRVLRKGGGTEQ